jgi:hypothetical protein
MLPGRGTSCQLPSPRAFFHDHEGFSVWANAKPFVIMVEGALQRDADGVGAGRRGWRGRKTASVAGFGLDEEDAAAERQARGSGEPSAIAVLHDHASVCIRFHRVQSTYLPAGWPAAPGASTAAPEPTGVAL